MQRGRLPSGTTVGTTSCPRPQPRPLACRAGQGAGRRILLMTLSRRVASKPPARARRIKIADMGSAVAAEALLSRGTCRAGRPCGTSVPGLVHVIGAVPEIAKRHPPRQTAACHPRGQWGGKTAISRACGRSGAPKLARSGRRQRRHACRHSRVGRCHQRRRNNSDPRHSRRRRPRGPSVQDEGHGRSNTGHPFPLLLDVIGTCPPEDVGGLPGYEHILSVRQNPDHPDRKKRSARMIAIAVFQILQCRFERVRIALPGPQAEPVIPRPPGLCLDGLNPPQIQPGKQRRALRVVHRP